MAEIWIVKTRMIGGTYLCMGAFISEEKAKECVKELITRGKINNRIEKI